MFVRLIISDLSSNDVVYFRVVFRLNIIKRGKTSADFSFSSFFLNETEHLLIVCNKSICLFSVDQKGKYFGFWSLCTLS